MTRTHCIAGLIELVIAIMLAASVAAAEGLGPPAKIALNGVALAPVPPARMLGGEVALPTAMLQSNLGIAVQHSMDSPRWVLTWYEHKLTLGYGRREYIADGTSHVTAQVPLVVDNSLYVPASLLTYFGLRVDPPTQDGEAFRLMMPGTRVADVRRGEEPDHVRFVLDLAECAPYSVTQEPGTVTLEIPQGDTDSAPAGQMRLLTFGDGADMQVTQLTTPDRHTRVVIPYRGDQPARVMALGSPPRIVVDLPREVVPTEDAQSGAVVPANAAEPVPAQASSPVVDFEPSPGDPVGDTELGVSYVAYNPPKAIIPQGSDPWPWHERCFGTGHGSVTAYVLRVDTRKGWAKIRPALAGKTVMTRATVPHIAERERATAAVNGGYFDWSGPPLGALIINREWIKPPIRNRTALGIMRDGSLRMGNLEFDGKAHFAGLGFVPVCGINQGNYEPDGVVLFTRRWGDYLPGDATKTYVVVNSKHRVQYVEKGGGPQNIPAGGFILSGTGARKSSLTKVKEGMKVTLSLRTAPEWPGLVHLLGAGPRLVKDGQLHITVASEKFDFDPYNTVKAQSALGITKQGELLLVVCENGLTMYEMACIIHDLGAYQAMRLDGGGSATAVAGHRVINHPTDGSARAVSNALLVFITPTKPKPKKSGRKVSSNAAMQPGVGE